MDYTALFEDGEDQIVFNKNEVQVGEKNNKRKVVYGLIGIGVSVLILVFVGILFGSNQVESVENQSICNATFQNCNSTSADNESQIDSKLEEKRQFVREMMIESWNVIVWPNVERNVSKNVYYYNGGFGKNSKTGHRIVASMSTIWSMGLKEEFEQGKKWIEEKLDLATIDREALVSDIATEYVGGLLSCYALTNEQLFMNKALTIAQLVEPAFNTSTGLPYHNIHLKTSKSSTSSEFKISFLGDVGGFKLDFNFLSDATGNSRFRDIIQKIQNALKESGKPKKIYFEQIDIDGKWRSTRSDLFHWSRDFYASLVKSYIQSNYLDVQSIEMYKDAMDAAFKMFEVSPGGLNYARSYNKGGHPSIHPYYESKMYYSGCYLGAMLSLGACAMQRALALNSSIGDKDKVTQQNRINRHWHLAIQITRTCQLASDRTKTGLGPFAFYFNKTHDVIPDNFFDYYALSPELAESNFILWRLTHNEEYRDNAWEMAQAIHRHCRLQGGGYSGISNVNEVPTDKYIQPYEFLSATLKYLYLTFTSDSVLPLDQWVFNSKGHPLPICGNNTMYPTCISQF